MRLFSSLLLIVLSIACSLNGIGDNLKSHRELCFSCVAGQFPSYDVNILKSVISSTLEIHEDVFSTDNIGFDKWKTGVRMDGLDGCSIARSVFEECSDCCIAAGYFQSPDSIDFSVMSKLYQRCHEKPGLSHNIAYEDVENSVLLALEFCDSELPPSFKPATPPIDLLLTNEAISNFLSDAQIIIKDIKNLRQNASYDQHTKIEQLDPYLLLLDFWNEFVNDHLFKLYYDDSRDACNRLFEFLVSSDYLDATSDLHDLYEYADAFRAQRIMSIVESSLKSVNSLSFKNIFFANHWDVLGSGHFTKDNDVSFDAYFGKSSDSEDKHMNSNFENIATESDLPKPKTATYKSESESRFMFSIDELYSKVLPNAKEVFMDELRSSVIYLSDLAVEKSRLVLLLRHTNFLTALSEPPSETMGHKDIFEGADKDFIQNFLKNSIEKINKHHEDNVKREEIHTDKDMKSAPEVGVLSKKTTFMEESEFIENSDAKNGMTSKIGIHSILLGLFRRLNANLPETSANQFANAVSNLRQAITPIFSAFAGRQLSVLSHEAMAAYFDSISNPTPCLPKMLTWTFQSFDVYSHSGRRTLLAKIQNSFSMNSMDYFREDFQKLNKGYSLSQLTKRGTSGALDVMFLRGLGINSLNMLEIREKDPYLSDKYNKLMEVTTKLKNDVKSSKSGYCDVNSILQDLNLNFFLDSIIDCLECKGDKINTSTCEICRSEIKKQKLSLAEIRFESFHGAKCTPVSSPKNNETEDQLSILADIAHIFPPIFTPKTLAFNFDSLIQQILIDPVEKGVLHRMWFGRDFSVIPPPKDMDDIMRKIETEDNQDILKGPVTYNLSLGRTQFELEYSPQVGPKKFFARPAPAKRNGEMHGVLKSMLVDQPSMNVHFTNIIASIPGYYTGKRSDVVSQDVFDIEDNINHVNHKKLIQNEEDNMARLESNHSLNNFFSFAAEPSLRSSIKEEDILASEKTIDPDVYDEPLSRALGTSLSNHCDYGWYTMNIMKEFLSVFFNSLIKSVRNHSRKVLEDEEYVSNSFHQQGKDFIKHQYENLHYSSGNNLITLYPPYLAVLSSLQDFYAQLHEYSLAYISRYFMLKDVKCILAMIDECAADFKVPFNEDYLTKKTQNYSKHDEDSLLNILSTNTTEFEEKHKWIKEQRKLMEIARQKANKLSGSIPTKADLIPDEGNRIENMETRDQIAEATTVNEVDNKKGEENASLKKIGSFVEKSISDNSNAHLKGSLSSSAMPDEVPEMSTPTILVQSLSPITRAFAISNSRLHARFYSLREQFLLSHTVTTQIDRLFTSQTDESFTGSISSLLVAHFLVSNRLELLKSRYLSDGLLSKVLSDSGLARWTDPANGDVTFALIVEIKTKLLEIFKNDWRQFVRLSESTASLNTAGSGRLRTPNPQQSMMIHEKRIFDVQTMTETESLYRFIQPEGLIYLSPHLMTLKTLLQKIPPINIDWDLTHCLVDSSVDFASKLGMKQDGSPSSWNMPVQLLDIINDNVLEKFTDGIQLSLTHVLRLEDLLVLLQTKYKQKISNLLMSPLSLISIPDFADHENTLKSLIVKFNPEMVLPSEPKSATSGNHIEESSIVYFGDEIDAVLRKKKLSSEEELKQFSPIL